MRVFRYFGGFLEAQEKWLNKMAEQGYRLARTTSLMYEFDLCAPSQYEYQIEFIADKDQSYVRDYRSFLEEMGYRTFTKNINLNFSIGKLRWRPWAKGTAQIATNPGSYNQELLIVERERDGKLTSLHTGQDAEAVAVYIKKLRNTNFNYGLILALGCLLSIFMSDSKAAAILLGALSVFFFIQAVFFALALRHANNKKDKAENMENV